MFIHHAKSKLGSRRNVQLAIKKEDTTQEKDSHFKTFTGYLTQIDLYAVRKN